MRIVVQKFGGTSVASHEGRIKAAEHIERALFEKYGVVVVVSAMGRKGDPYATDTLLKSINDTGCASKRDLDILMSCGEAISAVKVASLLRSRGHEVVVFSGQQAGIITDDEFGRARILEVRPSRILEAVEQGQIVIVMGFQGATADGDITTLDRGGSDTTAAALGVALKASYIDIFTDVEGIMTADPRIVPDAVCIREIDYKDTCNLANYGAKVIHPHAVEIAMQKKVPIRVRSTFLSSTGTLVTDSVSRHCVTGITQKAEAVQILIEKSFVDKYKVLEILERHGIHVSVSSGREDKVFLAVSKSDMEFVSGFLSRQGYTPNTVSNCAEVAVIGPSMVQNPSVKKRLVNALTKVNIDIMLLSEDLSGVVWCLVQDCYLEKTVKTLYQEFQLNLDYDKVLA